MPKFDVKNAVVTGNTFVPQDMYRLHVKKAKFGTSSNGNPMLTVTTEIISPEVVEAFSEQLAVAGREVTYWFTFTEKNIGRMKPVFERLGILDQVDEVDTDIPEDQRKLEGLFDRLCFDAILSSKERIKRKAPTPEQRAKGELGDKILDHAGKEVKLGWDIQANLDDINGNPEYVQY